MNDTTYIAIVLTITHLVFGYIHLEMNRTELSTSTYEATN